MRADTETTGRSEAEGFESILFPGGADGGPPCSDEALHDLALDQVFERIGDDAPRAAAAFRTPLPSTAAVGYRQDVFRGLEDARLRSAVDAFLRRCGECDRLDEAAAGAHYPYQAELRHLGAVAGYADAVEGLHHGLEEAVPRIPASAGWSGLRRHVAEYLASPVFGALETEAVRLQDLFSSLRPNVLIQGAKVTVAATDDEPDLGASVTRTFERFRRGEAADHRTAFSPRSIDHVQAWILERAALVHPEEFSRLVRFRRETPRYRDDVLSRFADEIRFYTAYADHLAPLLRAGLPVCRPCVSSDDKALELIDGWDLALAPRLLGAGRAVVTNDVTLEGAERIVVVSGPNQGGKTTTARMFGQAHHLAAIGCPIPGRRARVFLSDRVMTVFEREEEAETPEGRLGSEIRRLHELLGEATDRTVIVINEAFAGTALHDASILTRDVLERIGALGALAVCVTFIDELSRLDERTVSMVSAVDPADPAVRTFRVERRVADGRAYARALAAKYGLTADRIAAALGRGGPGGASAGPAVPAEDEKEGIPWTSVS